jgi:hypothetical protein
MVRSLPNQTVPWHGGRPVVQACRAQGGLAVKHMACHAADELAVWRVVVAGGSLPPGAHPASLKIPWQAHAWVVTRQWVGICKVACLALSAALQPLRNSPSVVAVCPLVWQACAVSPPWAVSPHHSRPALVGRRAFETGNSSIEHNLIGCLAKGGGGGVRPGV